MISWPLASTFASETHSEKYVSAVRELQAIWQLNGNKGKSAAALTWHPSQEILGVTCDAWNASCTLACVRGHASAFQPAQTHRQGEWSEPNRL